MLAKVAQTWHQRPSAMVGVADPVVAYGLDEALAIRLWADKASRQPGGETYRQPNPLPPGMRYETHDDAMKPGLVH